jgi:RNA polymerase sigma-70 factor, ECF subfamily
MNEDNSAESGLSADKKAEFEILVKSNMKRAYFAALGFLGSHDAAMDVSQEAFIRAFKSFRKFDSTKNFFTWYYKILKNLCLNFIRDNKRKSAKNFLEFRDEISANTFEEFENYSYKEIAEMLNIPIGTVMSGLFYARKKLAEELRGVL